MSLRRRVQLALAALLVLTVLGAWAVAGLALMRPVLRDLLQERVMVATYVARSVRGAPDPDAAAAQLASAVGAEARVVPELPEPLASRPPRRTVTRGPWELWIWQGRRTPVAIPLEAGGPWLVIWFPVDLLGIPRRLMFGLFLLLAGSLGVAALASRWVMAPLERALTGMARVGAGDLAHRLPEGDDASGQIGRAFNQMADRVGGRVGGQRQLLAAVSHELRTPLSRLRLQAELLADAGAPPDRLAALARDSADMDDLVGELLESARLEQGARALRLEDVAVDVVLAEALGTVDLEDRPVELRCPPDLRWRLDPARVNRALVNLLSNAVRYTPPGTPIAIGAEVAQDRLVIRVADRGPGVSEEALARLFDPFFRADASRSRASGGLGLGLMLVRQIAEAHGGQAVAALREGGGLEVRVTLAPQQVD